MKQMIKVSQRHGWTACQQNDGCGAADGRTVVWVTETEEVVSMYTSPPFAGRLANPPQNHVSGAIDGFRSFIKDTSQSIRFLSGKTIDDYKHFVDSFIGGLVFNDQQDPYRWACKLVNQPFPKDLQNLDWTKTSIIIMDVWDRHKLRGDAMRTNELARPINEFISRARKKGALIIHSPSSSDSGQLDDTIKGRYDATPQRQMAIDARGAHRPDPQWQRQDFYYLGLPGERAFDWIVGSGNDWAPEGVIAWNQGIPTQQNAAISVLEGDAMSADGLDGSGDGNAFQEVLALTKDRPYLVYVGTATNQCVIRRTNGMRNLYKAGKSLWIVKDPDRCGRWELRNWIDGLCRVPDRRPGTKGNRTSGTGPVEPL